MKFTMPFVLVLLLTSFKSIAQDKCNTAAHEQAAIDAGAMRSLKDIANYQRNYHDCVFADVDEVYGEAVSVLLDESWSKVVNSPSVAETDVMDGLLKGVSEIWEFHRSDRIYSRAKSKCPKRAAKLCKKIVATHLEARKKKTLRDGPAEE